MKGHLSVASGLIVQVFSYLFHRRDPPPADHPTQPPNPLRYWHVQDPKVGSKDGI